MNMAFTMLPSPVPKRRKGFASNCKQRFGFLPVLRDFSHFNKCLSRNIRKELSKRIIIFAAGFDTHSYFF